MKIALHGMRIIARSEDSVYLRLPDEWAEPIPGGCSCKYCLAHPDLTPKWDTLGVPISTRLYSWTLHAPEWTPEAPFVFPVRSAVTVAK